MNTASVSLEILIYIGATLLLAIGALALLHRGKTTRATLPQEPSSAPPPGATKVEESLETAVEETEPPKAESEPVETAKVPWKLRLIQGLKRTHGQIFRSIDEMLLPGRERESREKTLENLFEALILADVGVNTSELLVNKVREQLSGEEGCNPKAIKEILRREILAILSAARTPEHGVIEASSKQPHVVLMVGVNGVGKTTTAGKLAFKANQRGLRAVVGAADTYRAAAVEQLKVWAERSGAEFVQLKDGSDPASVAFEAVRVARQDNLDLCLVDTAGRLHNRNDLMQELAKIRRVMGKDDSTAPHEVLLVLDATTGQNALQQAKVFRDMVNITGLVITKLDGTAKGGVAIAVVNELKIPIRYIGVGESVEDLEVFSSEEFVDALFAEEG
jgi:fused signal recognition particle receptor